MAAPKPDNPYAKAIARVKRRFIGVALLSAAVNVLMLTGPVFMLQLYDRVLSSQSVATLQGLFIIVVVLYGFLALYDFLRTRMLSRAAYRLDHEVGDASFRQWTEAGLDPAASMARPVSDLAIVRAFLPSPAMLGLFDLPWIPFYLLVVWLVHPWLGMLATAGAGTVLFLALANQALTGTPQKRALAMDGAEAFSVEQARRNSESLVALGMLDRVTGRWRRSHDAGLHLAQRAGDWSEGFTAGSKAFRLLLQSGLLALGGFLALRQEISPGMIVAASIIAGRALAPVDQVLGQWKSIIRAREAHRRLKDTLGTAAIRRRPDTTLPPRPAS